MGSHLKKKRREADDSPKKSDAVYADNRELLANPSAQAESMLCSLEEGPRCIGLYTNEDEIFKRQTLTERKGIIFYTISMS